LRLCGTTVVELEEVLVLEVEKSSGSGGGTLAFAAASTCIYSIYICVHVHVEYIISTHHDYISYVHEFVVSGISCGDAVGKSILIQDTGIASRAQSGRYHKLWYTLVHRRKRCCVHTIYRDVAHMRPHHYMSKHTPEMLLQRSKKETVI
jgi:hypothetical protein